jgi:acetylornithine deacetylase/succinyl-diaminopimelate desuccinylase-like protein
MRYLVQLVLTSLIVYSLYMSFKTPDLNECVNKTWDDTLPAFLEFIQIQNLSPEFDKTPEDKRNAFRASVHIHNWIIDQGIKGLNIHLDDKESSPFIIVTVDATNAKMGHVLMYGHLDKQPPLLGKWSDGLHPYEPKIIDNKIYGRGTVDDGYAIFTMINVIKIMQRMNMPHGKFTLIIESEEESGSEHLPYFLEKYTNMITTPDYIIAMDSGSLYTNDRIWFTTSLRGCITAELKVEVMNKECHSGDGGGIVPEPFHIARQLINRLYDPRDNTCHLHVPPQICTVPEMHLHYAQRMIDLLGTKLFEGFSLLHHVTVGDIQNEDSRLEKYLDGTWRPTVTIIGIDGMPSTKEAGNIISPNITLKLSIRTPPNVPASFVFDVLEKFMDVKNNSNNAKVTLTKGTTDNGWYAKNFDNKLTKTLDEISFTHYGNPAGYCADGASIPFVHIIQNKFPTATMLVTGVIEQDSNIHAPDENLNVITLKKFMKFLVSFLSR